MSIIIWILTISSPTGNFKRTLQSWYVCILRHRSPEMSKNSVSHSAMCSLRSNGNEFWQRSILTILINCNNCCFTRSLVWTALWAFVHCSRRPRCRLYIDCPRYTGDISKFRRKKAGLGPFRSIFLKIGSTSDHGTRHSIRTISFLRDPSISWTKFQFVAEICLEVICSLLLHKVNKSLFTNPICSY